MIPHAVSSMIAPCAGY